MPLNPLLGCSLNAPQMKEDDGAAQVSEEPVCEDTSRGKVNPRARLHLCQSHVRGVEGKEMVDFWGVFLVYNAAVNIPRAQSPMPCALLERYLQFFFLPFLPR